MNTSQNKLGNDRGKVVAIVEARMKSTRLPGKSMRPILGRPMLELLIERLRRASLIDDVVIATTSDPSDDVIESLCLKLGVGCFRGSMNDVLDRVLRAAQKYNVNVIVEITGDCPFTDPAIVDQVVGFYLANYYDFVDNSRPSTYPNGFVVRAFSTNVLQEVASLTDDPSDHEHVSLYIYEHPERYTLFNVESGLPEKYHDYRLTVDTAEDFSLVNAIFESLYSSNPEFSLAEILAFLDENPKLLEINRHIQQKPVR